MASIRLINGEFLDFPAKELGVAESQEKDLIDLTKYIVSRVLNSTGFLPVDKQVEIILQLLEDTATLKGYTFSMSLMKEKIEWLVIHWCE